MALAGPGDETILAAPSYFNYQMWLEMLGISPVYLPFRPERGGVPDPADAAARITSPHPCHRAGDTEQPHRRHLPAEAIEGFHRLAREAGLALVLDETYRDFLPGDGPPHGLFARPDWDETLVHLYSSPRSTASPATGSVRWSQAAGCLQRSPRPPIAWRSARPPSPRRRHSTAFATSRTSVPRSGASCWSASPVSARCLRRESLAYELISAGAFFAYVPPSLHRHACRRCRPQARPGGERALPARQRLRPGTRELPALRPREHRRRCNGGARRSPGGRASSRSVTASAPSARAALR